MFRQPGFIGGLLGGDSRGPDPDPTADVDVAGGLDGKPPIRLGEPDQQSPDAGFGVPSGFDPVWGSLGPQPAGEGGWNREYEAQFVPNSNSITMPVATPMANVNANTFVQNRAIW